MSDKPKFDIDVSKMGFITVTDLEHDVQISFTDAQWLTMHYAVWQKRQGLFQVYDTDVPFDA